ncbi:hypothetical protein IMSAG049_00191 [Clostridiales bacterium]|nr:hypothetical protein IMSAG049_00191 [Clostridiales bacterium]
MKHFTNSATFDVAFLFNGDTRKRDNNKKERRFDKEEVFDVKDLFDK